MKTNYIQYMTDQVNSAGDNIRYTSPQVKVLDVKMHHVLCQSPGNESLGERDISDFFNED